jgi:hypothetical protein
LVQSDAEGTVDLTLPMNSNDAVLVTIAPGR